MRSWYFLSLILMITLQLNVGFAADTTQSKQEKITLTEPALVNGTVVKIENSNHTTENVIAMQDDVVTITTTATETAQADRILMNGVILTLDKKNTVAQAIAIKNGKVIAIGDNDTVLKLKGNKTQVEDLNHMTVIPGVNNSMTAGNLIGDEFTNVASKSNFNYSTQFVAHKTLVNDKALAQIDSELLPNRAIERGASANLIITSAGPFTAINPNHAKEIIVVETIKEGNTTFLTNI